MSVLTIEEGGTGANNAAEARENLGINVATFFAKPVAVPSDEELPTLDEQEYTYTISNNDVGKFLFTNATSGSKPSKITFVIPKGVQFEDGAELEICHRSETRDVYISAEGGEDGVMIYGANLRKGGVGQSAKIAGRFNIAGLKKVNAKEWILFGGVMDAT